MKLYIAVNDEMKELYKKISRKIKWGVLVETHMFTKLFIIESMFN